MAKINWKLYLILLAATLVSIIAILPYAFTLAGDSLKDAPLPLPVIVLLSVIQSSVIFAVVIFLGMKLSQKVGLGMPFIEERIAGKKTHDFRPTLKTSILLGVVASILIIAVDFLFTNAGVQISLWTGQMPPFWMGILASFYGGIAEEILLRLFFMTLLVWLFSRFKKTDSDIKHNSLIMWSSIIIASVIFGLGHLPITASVTPLTTMVIARAIALNGIGGMIFGWLYWKKGLESAIIAHFSADLVLHAIFPLFLLIVH